MILRPNSLVRLGVAVLLAMGLVAAIPGRPFAHDIPSRVTVIAFVKPDGHDLRVVLRVPLAAMRDVNFPLVGPGYLDLAATKPLLEGATKVWLADDLTFYEGDAKLAPPKIVATQLSLPSDRSFAGWDSAYAHTMGSPLPQSTEIMWTQAMLDVVLDYAITSDSARFSVRPELARLGVRTTTVLRFLPKGGSERAFEYLGDPGLVRLDPRWYQASLRFIRLGFEHILDGIDHLLFIFCLVIPYRKIRPLVAIITSFTVAHSITLIASAAGFAPSALWFPPLIEVLIAASIVYMALENIAGAKLERRWLIAFGFGLVHGFGFSFALRESLQFAGGHLASSLVSFNVGVELGQLVVLCFAIPALALLFKHVVAERMGTIILSALVAHTSWHWMTERFGILRQYDFTLPALNAATMAAAMRGLILVLLIVAAGWGMYELYARLFRGAARPSLAPESERK